MIRKLIYWKNKHFERNDSFIKIFFVYLVLLIFCVIAVYPLLNVLAVSLRPGDALFSTDLSIIPKNATLDNYRKAIFEIDLMIWLRNSLIIAVCTTVLAVTVSSTAAYSFSRFKFFGRKSGMMSLLITQMFPAPMLLLPTYILLSKLHLINNFFGLLVPYTATAVPFAIWNLKGYFDTIPRSLEESAYIDGCSPFRTFFTIILPLAKPALAVTALFAFMTAWSEFVVAKIVMSSPDRITLPVG
ncbi:MAG: ABC transporter permease subunit, partial [Vallitaleaceae bacterium]|nr:ABC transporter permease subunit [Vallitaleaceae bacterium]